MFYRSMKSNTPPAITYLITTPALGQIAMIALSIGVSAVCLVYEFYCKWFKKPETRPVTPTNITQKSHTSPLEHNETEINLAQTIDNNVIMEDYIP